MKKFVIGAGIVLAVAGVAFAALMKMADDLDLYDEVDEDDSDGKYEASLEQGQKYQIYFISARGRKRPRFLTHKIKILTEGREETLMLKYLIFCA